MAIQYQATVRCKCGRYLTNNEYYFYRYECTDCIFRDCETRFNNRKQKMSNQLSIIKGEDFNEK